MIVQDQIYLVQWILVLIQLIEGSKNIFLERGGNKKLIKEEEVTSAFAFSSVVADKEIKKGEQLTKENSMGERPGGGDFSAADYENLIGKNFKKKFIKRGSQLKSYRYRGK